MELLASTDRQEVWIDELRRPYSLASPFAGMEYVCILFANDELTTKAEQNLISERLIETGCKYAVCAGHNCSSWDDSVDMAHLAMYDFNPPEDEHVMTTWHENESVEEILHFGLNNTDFDRHEFVRYLILFVGERQGLRHEVEIGVQSQWRRLAG